MKRAALLVMVLFAATAGVANSQAPASPPPEFVFVAGVDKDKGTVKTHTVVVVPVAVEVVKTVVMNGMQVMVKVVETRFESKTVESILDLKAFRVTDGKGKEVAADDVLKRLAAGKVVMKLPTLAPLDPAYQKALAEDVLILTPKERP